VMDGGNGNAVGDKVEGAGWRTHRLGRFSVRR
jgi:hypothetical protein